MEEPIIHHNEEYWGTAETIVLAGGAGVCKLSFYNDEPTAAWLYNISVIPEKREQGIGQALLNEAFERAAKERPYLYLNVAPGSWVKDWYIRNGFEVLGPSDVWQWIVLRKNLRDE